MIILVSKIVTIHHKKTCMRLTNFEWDIFDAVCKFEQIKRKSMLENISENRNNNLNLTSAVRLFLLLYLFSKFQYTSDPGKKYPYALQQAIDKLN